MRPTIDTCRRRMNSAYRFGRRTGERAAALAARYGERPGAALEAAAGYARIVEAASGRAVSWAEMQALREGYCSARHRPPTCPPGPDSDDDPDDEPLDSDS